MFPNYSGLQTPPVTKNLLIITVLCFAAQFVLKSTYGWDLEYWLGLHFFLASDFNLYQFFTYMFIHANLEHLFFNMFAVWMFGRIIESVLGSRRFLFYYIACGLGAGLIQEGVQFVHYMMLEHADWAIDSMGKTLNGSYVVIEGLGRMDINTWYTVGASGAVYGVLLAFGMIFPNERLFIFPIPVPIKAKYLVAGYAVLELLMAHSNDGVAHYAHLGGMLFGFLILLFWGYKGGGFGGGKGGGFSSKWSDLFKRKKKDSSKIHIYSRNVDIQYNKDKKEQEKEVDKILDKVKKHGYASLSEEEKKKLFDFGQKN